MAHKFETCSMEAEPIYETHQMTTIHFSPVEDGR